MTEPTLSVVATVIGVAYVLTYAWAQLEILAYLTGLWQENKRGKTLGLGLLWAVMNCFSFLIAHNVHYSIVLHGRLVLYDLDAWWAKASAVLIVIVYWLWVGASLKFAFARWREARKSEE